MNMKKWTPVYNETLCSEKPIVRLNAVTSSIIFNKAAEKKFINEKRGINIFLSDNIVGFKVANELDFNGFKLCRSSKNNKVYNVRLMSRKIFDVLKAKNFIKELNAYYAVEWDEEDELIFINLDSPLKLKEINTLDMPGHKHMNKLHKRLSREYRKEAKQQ